MEGLIAIAIIWFVFSRLKKSTGKKAQPAKKPVAPRPLQQARRDIRRDKRDRFDSHESSGERDDKGTISAPVPHDAREGASLLDEQGCIGGSIPHDTHEGSAASVQSRSRPKEIERPGTIRHKGYALTPAGMRSAVIMAEILSRPVSMRRNGRTIR